MIGGIEGKKVLTTEGGRVRHKNVGECVCRIGNNDTNAILVGTLVEGFSKVTVNVDVLA